MKSVESILAICACCLFILPSYTPYHSKLDAKISVQYIAYYDDGEIETLYNGEIIPAIGEIFYKDACKYRVKKVTDYWYDGMALDTLAYIAYVECIK